MKSSIARKTIRTILDLALVIPVVISGSILLLIRRHGAIKFKYCKKALDTVGVVPIGTHYYEPQLKYDDLSIFETDRNLPLSFDRGILSEMRYYAELKDLEFDYENGAFPAGDAEVWYQIIRSRRPKTIIEIGSGYSTLMARHALRKTPPCTHICVEPFEHPELESLGVDVVREKVENLGTDFFSVLDENDILFIDSSHVIRPGGDVLFEYLELLPSLKKGVIVHIHDIFSPRHYLKRWVVDEARLWNEQYLLEAFLVNNSEWRILGALNWLYTHYYGDLKKVCPNLEPNTQPGSIYIEKVT